MVVSAEQNMSCTEVNVMVQNGGTVYSRLRLGIFSCLALVEALPLLSTAKAMGEGGGAGGMSSTKLGCSLPGFECEALMMAREMSWEKVARASWVVGGATETGVVVEAEIEAIVEGG